MRSRQRLHNFKNTLKNDIIFMRCYLAARYILKTRELGLLSEKNMPEEAHIKSLISFLPTEYVISYT